MLAVALAGSLSTGVVVATPSAAATASARFYRLIQYPGAGFGGVYAQIGSARRSIDMEMYELKDPTAERDLAAAAHRGVSVRVLLDSAYHGAEVNRAAYAYLRSQGVHVRWAPSGYIFHIKSTVFDGAVADVSTANLTSEYYSDTRDAELIDSNPVQVRAIEATFGNDWSAAPGGDPRAQTVQAPGLIWSPESGAGSAEQAVVAVISAARASIEFESEELSDPAIYEALAADARRHVDCEVVMTDDSEWDRAFGALTAAGCRVRLIPDTANALYIHEKVIVTDAGTPTQSLLLGSQNGSWDSLHRNRELAVLVTDADGGAGAITAAGTAFSSDFNSGNPYR
jgi:phosphatidylserine/phosphatidylglycerophosphate/cardiolipin synthase-like enzyme